MTHRPANDLNQPHRIISILLWGTTVVLGLLTLLLCHSFLIGNSYVAPRLIVAGTSLVYVGIVWSVFRKERYQIASWMIIALLLFIAIVFIFESGINTAAGILLLGFIIILSGALLGSRFIIPVTVVIIAILGCIQILTQLRIAHTDMFFRHPSTVLDVIQYSVMLAIFALIAWLSGRRMEQSLARALEAESGLAQEKALLSVRLEDKTREVKEAQLVEMRQLYQFAELGQLGTVLLHDLANNLTALTLDIDDIGRRLQRNESITRAKESIAYLESMVNGVRRQIQERDKPVLFDAMRAVFETIAADGQRARRSGVTIEYVPLSQQAFTIKGDPIRFAHILTILINNAIDAYVDSEDQSPSVVVTAAVKQKLLHIRVVDHGIGINEADRENLFKPFSSTKPDGMGIGLFMAREMTEQHFEGTLAIEPTTAETVFALSLPRYKAARRKRSS